MAVTIISTPKDYAPVYNEMVFTASSTNTAQANFNFLVDIYINGSGTKTARLRIPPEPTGNYCVVDIHRVLEATLTSDIFSTSNTSGSVACSNSSLSYVVKFGEEYGSTVTQYPDLTVDSTRYAINGSLERNEFIDYTIVDYTPLDSTIKFLTNSPSTLYTSINDYGALYFYDDGLPTTVRIETFDSSGSSIQVYEATLSGSGAIQYVPCNPQSLNLIGADLVTGSQDIIDSSVASYDVWLYDNVGTTQVTEKKNFIIREDCKNDLTRLIFLNKLGGWDSFNFYGASSESDDIERKMYKQNPYRLDGSGNYSYSKSDREKVQYYTKTKKKLKVYSDWITQEEDAWLLELIESPEIYLQSGADLISVASIDLTSHRKRQTTTDKLFNIELTLEFGYDNYRQRG